MRVKQAVKRIEVALSTSDPRGLQKERSQSVHAAGRLALNRSAIAREAGMSKNVLYDDPVINEYLAELCTPTPPEYATLTEHFTAQIVGRDKDLKAAGIILASAMESWGTNTAETAGRLSAEIKKATNARRREAAARTSMPTIDPTATYTDRAD